MWLNRNVWFPASSLVLTVLLLGAIGCGKVFSEKEDLPNAFELPAGTEIVVRPVADLSTDEMKVGDEFAGVLASPLYYKREKLDPQGKIFHEDVLIAPEGAVVKGKVVAQENPSDPATSEDANLNGLQLTGVTLHGGMSFDIVTGPVFKFGADSGEAKNMSSAKTGDVVAFKLAEPADVALVIDLRDKEAKGKEDRSAANESM